MDDSLATNRLKLSSSDVVGWCSFGWMNMAGFSTKSGLFYLFRQKNTEMFDTVVDGGLAVGSVPITIFNFQILLLVIG